MANALTITAAEVTTAMTFMLAQEGKPYSEALSGPLYRLGPNAYDCSGLVYAALHKIGVPIPQDESTANLEANWLGENGAQVIKDESQIKPGDILFFSSGDNGPSNYGGIGHTGMATTDTSYISAYDQASGILVNPIANDDFVVAMRLTNQTIAPDSGGGSSPGSGSGILGIDWGTLPQDFQDLDTMVKYILAPSSWVRIVAFLAGCAVLLFAIHALIAVGKGEPLINMPSQIPVPVPI
jgi:cell wall-associated NlpC family hydrolase